jgi:hypothetical protein
MSFWAMVRCPDATETTVALEKKTGRTLFLDAFRIALLPRDKEDEGKWYAVQIELRHRNTPFIRGQMRVLCVSVLVTGFTLHNHWFCG